MFYNNIVTKKIKKMEEIKHEENQDIKHTKFQKIH